MYQALYWESKGTTQQHHHIVHGNVANAQVGLWRPLLLEDWEMKKPREKNQLQQEGKKIQESFHSFFLDEKISKIKFAKW